MRDLERIPKPVMFGCYEKRNKIEKVGKYTIRHLTNSRLNCLSLDVLGMAEIEVFTRVPELNFIDNKGKPDISCIVLGGEGEIRYFFDNKADGFHLTRGDVVLIPRDALYAIEGQMKVLFVCAREWRAGNQQIVEID
jgi:hypothetical protein